MTESTTRARAAAPEVATSGARPGRVPAWLRGVLRWLGVVPFGVYIALGLAAPTIAIAVAAFRNSSTGAGTMSNITTALHGTYLLASEVQPSVPGFKIVIPTDGTYAAYYDQAISKYAPDPAAARLWEEYLYSATGQNLWLQGFARPIELSTLVANGTVNKTAYAELPPAPSGGLTFPSQAQQAAAENVVTQDWAKQVG